MCKNFHKKIFENLLTACEFVIYLKYKKKITYKKC